jgi:hypothetical protein
MIESFITIHNRNPNLKKCHIELDMIIVQFEILKGAVFFLNTL